MATPPHSGFVPSLRGAVEPGIHAPESVKTAGIGGVGVVYDPVLQDERTHAGPLPSVGRHVGSRHGGVLLDWPLALRGHRLTDTPCHRRLAAVVVLDGSLALLFLGKRGIEVEVEVAAH